MRTIVCDAGPIIHLYEAHCLQLLRQTGSLYLPRSVFNEVQTTLQIQEPWPEWLQIVSIFPHEQKEAGMWKEAGDLHADEAEALVLARRHKADWFLTDDSRHDFLSHSWAWKCMDPWALSCGMPPTGICRGQKRKRR